MFASGFFIFPGILDETGDLLKGERTFKLELARYADWVCLPIDIPFFFECAVELVFIWIEGLVLSIEVFIVIEVFGLVFSSKL